MLRKLMRHEFRFYRKFMLLALLALGVSLVLIRVTDELSSYILTRFADSSLGLFIRLTLPSVALVGYLGCIAALCIPHVLAAVRFYRNLSRDEGYLSFTLPVKPSHHVLCKTVVPFAWSVIMTFALILFGIFVFVPGYTSTSAGIETEPIATSTVILVLVAVFVFIFLSVLASIVQVNFSIACGQIFRKHKLLGSIGCYIALNTALQIVPGVVIYLPLFVIPIATLTFESYLIAILILSVVVYLAITAVLYFFTCRIMTKKLNLE